MNTKSVIKRTLTLVFLFWGALAFAQNDQKGTSTGAGTSVGSGTSPSGTGTGAGSDAAPAGNGSRNDGKRYTRHGKEIKKLTPEELEKMPDKIRKNSENSVQGQGDLNKDKPAWARPKNQGSAPKTEKEKVMERLRSREKAGEVVERASVRAEEAREKIQAAKDRLIRERGRLSQEEIKSREAKIKRAEEALYKLQGSLNRANGALKKGYN